MIKRGDTIRDCYGKKGTVIEVRDNMIFTTIDCGSWVHVTKAVKV